MIVDKKMNESNSNDSNVDSNDEYVRCLHLFISKYLKFVFFYNNQMVVDTETNGNNSNDSDIDAKNKHVR